MALYFLLYRLNFSWTIVLTFVINFFLHAAFFSQKDARTCVSFHQKKPLLKLYFILHISYILILFYTLYFASILNNNLYIFYYVYACLSML